MSEGTGYNLSFPTPESLPETTVCRIFTLPADRIFLGAFMGALEYLTDPDHWQAVGSVSAADSAQAVFDAIDAAYTLAEDGVCSAVVPAPYWDESSADDADDEAPAADQPWYGEIVSEGVTWREQVGIWAITAFVAVTATPAAAVAFLPFANRFVLAFKQHSAGAIIKVLIDGLEMATVDTYAPSDGVINVPISLPAPAGLMALDTDPPVMWVMMTDEANPDVVGTPNMQLIRKRLDQAEITPSNLRWNSDCDCVQQTPDNGSTWVDSPGQDPRTSTIFQVPARTGGDPKCDSATQMRDRVKNMLDAIITSSDILQAINSVVAVIAIFFLDFGIIIEAIWGIISAVFAIGTTTLNAALTSDVYDALLCIFYCRIGTDGSVTSDQYDSIVSDVNAQFDTVAAFAITQMLASIGFVGLSNAGALGEVTGDCSACACGWCFEVDLTADDGGFTAATGSYSAGWNQGFVNGAGCSTDATYTYLDMARTLPAGTYTKIYFVIELEKGTICETNTNSMHAAVTGGTLLESVTANTQPDGTHNFTWTGSMVDPAGIHLVWVCGEQPGTSNPGGTVKATKVHYEGTGDNPFGSDNC
jgi:hypothetical protein